MPMKRRSFERGFIDPLSLIGLGFLVVTLIVGTVTVNNIENNQNISEKAAGACGTTGTGCRYYDCSQYIDCSNGKLLPVFVVQIIPPLILVTHKIQPRLALVADILVLGAHNVAAEIVLVASVVPVPLLPLHKTPAPVQLVHLNLGPLALMLNVVPQILQMPAT